LKAKIQYFAKPGTVTFARFAEAVADCPPVEDAVVVVELDLIPTLGMA